MKHPLKQVAALCSAFALVVVASASVYQHGPLRSQLDFYFPSPEDTYDSYDYAMPEDYIDPMADPCSNGMDDDGDGYIDDEDCDSDSTLPSSYEDEMMDMMMSDPCTNGMDDDGDGYIDDEDCDSDSLYPAAYDEPMDMMEDTCTNGLDDDGDGYVDDMDCDTDPMMGDDDGGSLGGEPDPMDDQCSNGVDEDGDGYTDDADCDSDFMLPSAPPAAPGTPTDDFCTNGIDDDADGVTDDADCDSDPMTGGDDYDGSLGGEPDPMDDPCANGMDDDGDGYIDDGDCDSDPSSPGTSEDEDDGFQNGAFQNGNFQNGGYENGEHQNGGYENGQYNNGGYQNGSAGNYDQNTPYLDINDSAPYDEYAYPEYTIDTSLPEYTDTYMPEDDVNFDAYVMPQDPPMPAAEPTVTLTDSLLDAIRAFMMQLYGR